jgi:hypothetical protein
MAATTLALSSGHQMPAVGLGVWRMDSAALRGLIHSALRAGYRHFDCAGTHPRARLPPTHVHVQSLPPHIESNPRDSSPRRRVLCCVAAPRKWSRRRHGSHCAVEWRQLCCGVLVRSSGGCCNLQGRLWPLDRPLYVLLSACVVSCWQEAARSMTLGRWRAAPPGIMWTAVVAIVLDTVPYVTPIFQLPGR